MKPKNFPARKLARQMAAEKGVSTKALLNNPSEAEKKQLEQARTVRTKKS